MYKLLSKNYYNEFIEPCLTFSRDIVKYKYNNWNRNYENQYTSKSKLVSNFYWGKICEFVTWKINKKVGSPPSLEINKIGTVNFDSDYLNIEVKSCPSLTANRYGLSWNFTMHEGLNNKTGYVALYETQVDLVGTIKFYGYLDYSKVSTYLRDPIGDQYRGIKKVIRYEDTKDVLNFKLIGREF